MMTDNQKPTLDDVLNEFVAAYEHPTAEALEDWVQRYPEFRAELIDFAAAWAEQLVLPTAPELSAEEEKRLVDRAMSHVQNVAFSRDQSANTGQAGTPEIESLTGEAKKAGMNIQEFANDCGLDLVLVAKLNNRQIEPGTIPRGLVSDMARSLGSTVTAIGSYLALPPRAVAGMAFLARGKPQSAERQSFADAVRASSLGEAKKACWLDDSPGTEDQ